MATSPLTPASTIGAYGVQPEKLSDYDKALEDSIKALEQRYASPNYFNVAAGFFKPQLGGFAASLGSAAQALGENVEKERESQLPIAKMRAELALSRINMGKEKDAAAAFSTWKASKLPMDEATYAHIVGLSPNSSVAAAAKAAYEGERAGQTLETQQQQLAVTKYSQTMDILKRQREAGVIDEKTYMQRAADAEKAYGPKPPVAPTRPAGGPNTVFPAAVVAPAAAPVAAAAAPAAAAPAAPAAAGPTELPSGDLNTLVTLLGGSTANGPVVKGGPVAAANRGPADAAIEAFDGKGAPSVKSPYGDFKIKPTITVQNAQAMTNAEKMALVGAEKAALSLEESYAKQRANLQQITEPVAYTSASANNKFALSEIDKNPRLMAETTNLLRGAGPLAAMMQKGLGINLFGSGAGMNIDVRAGLVANLKPEQLAFYDKLANLVSQSVYNDLRARGQNPETMGAEKFGQAVMRELSMENGPKAIRHGIQMNQLRLEQSRALENAYQIGLKEAIAAGSATPHYDAYNQHPEFKIVQKMYQKKFDDANKAYEAKPKKDKP